MQGPYLMWLTLLVFEKRRFMETCGAEALGFIIMSNTGG